MTTPTSASLARELADPQRGRDLYIREQLRIRRERLLRLQGVFLAAERTLLGHVATLERNLADVDARGHRVDLCADQPDRYRDVDSNA